MILGLGALVDNLNVEAVRTALAEMRIREVLHWCHTHLGATVQSVSAKSRDALATEQQPPPLPSKDG